MVFSIFKHQAKTADSEDRAEVTVTGHVRTPLERSLVFRLDCFLMVFGCISQVIKYLDQQNVNTAYVSGMKEDLGLYGNELNYFTTYFNVGYCIMLVPSQIIMTHVRPSYWLPGLEIVWGILTGLIAMAHSAKQVYAIRTFLGLCESSAWPGMMTLFMHWYTPTELAKRMGFYHSCQAIGNMMANALQTAVQNTLDGHHGLAGWRWLFIVNGIITVVFAFFGFFLLPDLPNKPNPLAFWFTADHASMAMERLKRHNRAEPKRITLASMKRSFSNWVIYYITVLYVATVLASYGYVYFNLWLKSLTNPDGSQRWSVSEINVIPIGGGAIQVAFVWIWALLSDYLGNRHWLIIAQAVIGLIPCIIMTVWDVPDSAKYAAYFMCYIALGTAPLIFAWVSDLIPQDPEQRTLIVGVAVAIYYAIGAWSQVLVWPAKQAPHYRYGWQVSIGLWILVIGMTLALRYMDMTYMLPKRLAFGEEIRRQEEAQDSDPDSKSISKVSIRGV